ncbi:hypothetical protein EV426DRAFT_363597 [Tirmania nivea]|nr:hypothetical protein EV426DRAFT_363597 [Tirmania nivea]
MPAPIDTFPSSRNMQSDSQFSRGGASNLTLGLMAAGASGNGMVMDSGVAGSNGFVGSFTHSNGIPMNASRLRRESMAHRDLAGSLTNKMSWGGKSVESWVMDDLIMTGTSPFQAYQSPSFHSSSYLPKLEAQFFKDFSCCDVTLPSLHELLKHYEECHASQQMAPLGMDTIDTHDTTRQPAPTHQQNNGNHIDLLGQASRGAGVTSPISGMGGLGLSMRQQQLAASQQRHYQHQAQHQRRYGQREGDEDDLNDTEAAGEMDMDGEDLTPPPTHAQSHTPRHTQPPQLRLSAPGTPSHVLSSVNTPIMPHASLELPRHPLPLAGLNAFSPDSSVPGTPSAMEPLEFTFPHHMQAYGVPTVPQQQPQQQHQVNMASETMFRDLCIDEPAKRLYTPGGYGFTAAQMQHLKYSMGGLGGVQGVQNSNNNNNNNNGNPPGRVGGVQGLPIGGVEDKPFKCPVVGCEKAYKNQNGLKYHKSHGHTNQILSENGDGTLSIVNPETSTPYPGTLGMEKEKPYKCEVCGKRYKNLNGLKYHRAHSTHGNTPMPVQQQSVVPPSGVVAVAGGVAGEDMLR